MEGETDLFGNPVAPLSPREEPRPTTNDMGLIEDVLARASSVGFLLVGTRRDVFKRVSRDEVERVRPDVDHAVHQLIDTKWLEIGGTHHVRYERLQGPARSVLVPKRSRQALTRWRALCDPWKNQRRKGA